MKIYKAKYFGYLTDHEKEVESTDFDKYDLKYIPECEWVVYSYLIGDCCGGGKLIFKKESKIYYHDCDHCSCNRPTNSMDGGFEFSGPYGSLQELLANCSDELKQELKPLVDVINRENLT